VERDGVADHDVLGRRNEDVVGRLLLQQVMAGGQRTAAGRVSLTEARAHAKSELNRLPPPVRALQPACPQYPVEISAALAQDLDRLRRQHELDPVPR
jgi:nicotinate phosphoribosyltransferase